MIRDREANQFFWVGGHAGLDLVNTEAVGPDGERLELVARWEDLVDWAAAAGLIDAELTRRCRNLAHPRAGDVVGWFRRLRTALRAVLESPVEARATAGELDAVVAEVAITLRYAPGQTHAVAAATATGPDESLRLALALVALDAAALDRSRVRRCADRRCVLVYLDTTKNRSRRWCDMAVCGNRAKARAHYRRMRPGQPHIPGSGADARR